MMKVVRFVNYIIPFHYIWASCSQWKMCRKEKVKNSRYQLRNLRRKHPQNSIVLVSSVIVSMIRTYLLSFPLTYLLIHLYWTLWFRQQPKRKIPVLLIIAYLNENNLYPEKKRGISLIRVHPKRGTSFVV